MTDPQRVIVTGRLGAEVPGFTMVTAEVDGGVSGQYMIADGLVGTDAELTEIRAQSARRAEAIDQTGAGV